MGCSKNARWWKSVGCGDPMNINDLKCKFREQYIDHYHQGHECIRSVCTNEIIVSTVFTPPYLVPTKIIQIDTIMACIDCDHREV